MIQKNIEQIYQKNQWKNSFINPNYIFILGTNLINSTFCNLLIINIMQKITHKIQRLTHSNIFQYTPVSTFKIQNKINPIVSVTIGNKK